MQKLYKTLSEVKLEVETVIKTGRQIVQKQQTDNPKLMDEQLTSLKLLYNDLGAQVCLLTHFIYDWRLWVLRGGEMHGIKIITNSWPKPKTATPAIPALLHIKNHTGWNASTGALFKKIQLYLFNQLFNFKYS